jgi:uncharacterized protein (DUF305 family)
VNATPADPNPARSSQSVVGRLDWNVIRYALIGLTMLIAAFMAGKSINSSPGDDSSDVTFLREMIAHHLQAVEMSLIIRDRSKEENIHALSTDILLTQQTQIGYMQAWLGNWNVSGFNAKPLMGGNPEAMGMAPRPKVWELQRLPLKQAEIQFLQLMIRHHQGAVFMAEDVLKTAFSRDVRFLAENIKNTQALEIKNMTNLLTYRGAKPLEPLPRMTMNDHSTMGK